MTKMNFRGINWLHKSLPSIQRVRKDSLCDRDRRFRQTINLYRKLVFRVEHVLVLDKSLLPEGCVPETDIKVV